MIEGTKTVICGLTREATPEILKWVNDPALKPYTGTLYPVSEFEHENWIKNRAESSTDKLFLIKDKESNTNLGTIGLKNIDYIKNCILALEILNFSPKISGGGKRGSEVMQ